MHEQRRVNSPAAKLARANELAARALACICQYDIATDLDPWQTYSVEWILLNTMLSSVSRVGSFTSAGVDELTASTRNVTGVQHQRVCKA